MKEDFGLNFDNDNATSTEDRPKHIGYSILGFHPNKEIVFIHTPFNRVMAYHFNSPKIKEFCCLPLITQNRISLSFPYTISLSSLGMEASHSIEIINLELSHRFSPGQQSLTLDWVNTFSNQSEADGLLFF